ncbi:Protein MMS22-like [Stylophora pistillata]|uniref:Protein MMS22-like n=1 Tax=Stylophora pistillata TaxID=50429 RepID=A0A2B4T0B7_STYPI|nr:Protein MMS22-like [Stylophora pistillata]
MDHLSIKTDLESFWSAVSSIMSEILNPKESEPDSQDSTAQPWVESCAPPGFTVKTPVNFCWWLLTHLSPLYWFTDKGVYSQRKKSCVPGNWVLAQDLLKASLLNNKNSSFHIPEQSLHSFGLVSSSSLQWMEQCLNRSKVTQGGFYSKFHKRRMEELNITGLHHFISLFLTLSCVADLEDVANKLCSFLDLLDFHKMAQDKKISVWKGLFALMLIYKEKNVDFGYLAERLSHSFFTVAREYTESSQNKTRHKNCWQLITLYLDSTQDVFEHKNKQDLSESKLIADGLQYLLNSCRDNELRYLLSFVQTTLASLTYGQKNGGRPGLSDIVSVMWKHVFCHVRNLASDALCIQSVSIPLADTLAGFTLSALDRYPEEVPGVTGVTFTSLLRDLGVKDEMSASSSATTAIQAENIDGDIIHAWFRCLLQLPPSHEGLTELTRAVGKLPEMEKLLRGQPGFGTGESSETSLQLFIVALGRHHSSLTKFDESIQFRETVQRYLGDVIKYVDHVLRNVGPANQLRIAYHVAGLLTKHCYKIIYSRVLPSSTQAASIPTKNPFLVILKGSCLPNPAPENREFRQFAVEIIQENFLCLPQQPANLATTLSFLEQLFRKTLSSSETARNTPVLLESIMFCLLTCDQFTAGNEPPEIRRQATEILRLMVGACKKTPEMNSREVLLPHLRNFLYSKITLYQGLVFKTLESLVLLDLELVTALIPAGKQAVKQLEQKRGVGTDMQLRSSFKSFLSKLGHSGEEAIKDFEKENVDTQH